MSTITEVALAAGVSKATVSRVLSGTTPVKEGTKQRVLEAVELLKYSPNQAARALASKKTYTIGLVLYDIDSVYYGPAASAVESALRGEDRHVIIASGQGTLEGERDAVEFLIKRQVDALVLITSFLSAEDLVEIDSRCPVFVLNQTYPNSIGKTVVFDNYLGGFLATEYLIKKGYKKIASITGPMNKNDAAERFRGYQDALQQYGLTSYWYNEGNFTVKSGIQATRDLLAWVEQEGVNGLPDALVCGNDLTAIGAIHVCHEEKLSIPKDIAIIGFDDLDIAQYFTPSLTTVRMPLFQMADAIAKLLLCRIYDKKHNVTTLFKPEIVSRQSA